MASFTIPITHGGSLTCAPAPSVPGLHILTFTSPPDNRMTLWFIEAFLQALRTLEQKTAAKGALIITSGIAKFFSNGFDLDHVRANPDFFPKCNAMLAELLIYPMPTIALVNGHCFGAGVFLAMACDYRIQNPSKGFICLPEVDMGVTIPAAVAAMLRNKLSSQTYRDAVIEGRRWSGSQALEAGMVDALEGLEDAIKFAGGRKLVAKGNAGAVGLLKEDQYGEVLGVFEKVVGAVTWRREVNRAREQRKDVFEKEFGPFREPGSKL